MATKSIAWQTGTGNIVLTYTGQGNGTIQVDSSPNPLGIARSQVITVETTQGGVVTKNLTINQAACPFPVGEVRNYAYTGNYQEVELPAGTYKLQCWGAQGGSNGTNSTYGITAKAGGKGGYSEGILTLTQKTTVRVYVGGQGSASSGGYNGGGSTTGTSQYNSGDTFGYSKMGGGGGATDIRLSDGALLSRMIVAGGGSGGAMCYKAVTTSSTNTTTLYDSDLLSYTRLSANNGVWVNIDDSTFIDISSYRGQTMKVKVPGHHYILASMPSVGDTVTYLAHNVSGSTTVPPTEFTYTVPSNATYLCLNGYSWYHSNYSDKSKVQVQFIVTTSSTTTSTSSQVGYVGGGSNGGGYSSTYQGKQNAVGTGGSFGTGANQTATNYRYASGAGGGGWYGGGGGQKSDSTITYVKYSGGGSGWVNVAASAGNRPTGYTGLELDSGETRDGTTSFPNTAGTDNETGHSGNGYAKITRLS